MVKGRFSSGSCYECDSPLIVDEKHADVVCYDDGCGLVQGRVRYPMLSLERDEDGKVFYEAPPFLGYTARGKFLDMEHRITGGLLLYRLSSSGAPKDLQIELGAKWEKIYGTARKMGFKNYKKHYSLLLESSVRYLDGRWDPNFVEKLFVRSFAKGGLAHDYVIGMFKGEKIRSEKDLIEAVKSNMKIKKEAENICGEKLSLGNIVDIVGKNRGLSSRNIEWARNYLHFSEKLGDEEELMKVVNDLSDNGDREVVDYLHESDFLKRINERLGKSLSESTFLIYLNYHGIIRDSSSSMSYLTSLMFSEKLNENADTYSLFRDLEEEWKSSSKGGKTVDNKMQVVEKIRQINLSSLSKDLGMKIESHEYLMRILENSNGFKFSGLGADDRSSKLRKSIEDIDESGEDLQTFKSIIDCLKGKDGFESAVHLYENDALDYSSGTGKKLKSYSSLATYLTRSGLAASDTQRMSSALETIRKNPFLIVLSEGFEQHKDFSEFLSKNWEISKGAKNKQKEKPFNKTYVSSISRMSEYFRERYSENEILDMVEESGQEPLLYELGRRLVRDNRKLDISDMTLSWFINADDARERIEWSPDVVVSEIQRLEPLEEDLLPHGIQSVYQTLYSKGKKHFDDNWYKALKAAGVNTKKLAKKLKQKHKYWTRDKVMSESIDLIEDGSIKLWSKDAPNDLKKQARVFYGSNDGFLSVLEGMGYELREKKWRTLDKAEDQMRSIISNGRSLRATKNRPLYVSIRRRSDEWGTWDEFKDRLGVDSDYYNKLVRENGSGWSHEKAGYVLELLKNWEDKEYVTDRDIWENHASLRDWLVSEFGSVGKAASVFGIVLDNSFYEEKLLEVVEEDKSS